jgi:hypothetical protein
MAVSYEPVAKLSFEYYGITKKFDNRRIRSIIWAILTNHYVIS